MPIPVPKPERKQKRREALRERRRVYGVARASYLKRNRVCAVCQRTPSVEVHHKLGRDGDRLLDEQYWLAVCHPCHQVLHNNPAWAYTMGYLLRRNAQEGGDEDAG